MIFAFSAENINNRQRECYNFPMPKIKVNLGVATRKAQKYQLAVVSQILSLATNGFGLVAALAWNNVIKEIVDQYLKPLLGAGSGLASLFIYATIVTFLAVTVTIQLSKLKEALEQDNEYILQLKKKKK